MSLACRFSYHLMANRKISQLELFVQSFIRTHRKAVVGNDAIAKAITLIDTKLANPHNQLVLHELKHNELTKGVLGILNDMPVLQQQASVLRAKTLLQNYPA